jgi:hypothetical protein
MIRGRPIIKDSLRSNINTSPIIAPYLRQNNSTLYNNTVEDKELIVHHLENRASKSKKTLIYYTVFGSVYKEIFEYSLKSVRYFYPEADIVCISDQTDLPVDTLLQAPVDDFIQASMKKLDIFLALGSKIYNYDQVLFLDADVLAIKPLNFLNGKATNNKIEVVKSGQYSNINPESFVNHFHGINLPLSDKQKKDIIKKKIMPFNAGHFLFTPNKELKDDFDNIRWLSKIWPGDYFYEQGFMNYYFGIVKQSVSYKVLNPNVEFCSLNKGETPKGNRALIHFIGSQITPEVKLNAMKNAYERFIQG